MLDPPPILPDIDEELRQYLICPEKLPIHEFERNQQYWPRKIDPTSLFHFENAPVTSTLKVQRDPNTGEVVGFREVSIQGASASTSGIKEAVSNFPIWPECVSDPVPRYKAEEFKIDDLLTVPPGFSRGLQFDSSGHIKDSSNTFNYIQDNIVNLTELIQQQDLLGLWSSNNEKATTDEVEEKTADLPEEEGVLPYDVPVFKISQHKPASESGVGTEWAIKLDTSKDVTDFKERIPEMAMTFEFELDNFQKQAILQLEMHNHVFVAAHTSAGKTVVAEYAIALSQKHMSRTIYTSPIKALSNQKYRDFKRKFKDVGLITGDLQINPTGTCLIMTTEILRSMLYRRSEVTSNLEYVIFDEVHYINDKERGHVWEQVLILLPSHVCVVLLSATVPNAVQFADWLGRTYQKKVYVVSTVKRPVPLEHYLYTGCGGKSRDQRYLILDSQGNFQPKGYDDASNSMKMKEKKPEKETAKAAKPIKKEPYRPQSNHYNPGKDKVMWQGLIDHLRRQKKSKTNDEQKDGDDEDEKRDEGLLPIIAFTFSRARCDQNAEALKSLDLTTQKEKHAIHQFFENCIKTLKEPDRNIPQVVNMREILKMGIGVHHSGILPIMKEMVEMLFQWGKVKLLFATETFAMGVNMPARTVVFDSITKNDGRQSRNLLLAEYIQMAGRAGRRGLDKIGTVILICKGAVPKRLELEKMMTGIPSQLESQFRITYGMVLSLLRVESLTVEGMMSRSFREADHQKELIKKREELKLIEEKLEEATRHELSDYLKPLVPFYASASSYLTVRSQILPELMQSPRISKELIPGKVVLITHKHHINKLALILNVSTKRNNFSYKVLVLSDGNEKIANHEDMWYKMLGLASEQIYNCDTKVNHEVLTINSLDIFEITSKTIKVDTDVVVRDWDNRQIPRFKNDPPGQSCNAAVQELLKLSMAQDQVKKGFLDFINDLHVNEIILCENIMYLTRLKEIACDRATNTRIPNFQEHFQAVFARKSLEDKRDQLLQELSYAGMPLYHEYQNRIKLLKELDYITEENRVKLKGQVACEMGMNELLITELLLEDTLNKLKPAEVAPLLSALVFRAKTNVEPQLTEELKRGKAAIERVNDKITALETKYQVITDSVNSELNFGLVEVVYQWAMNKPFAEIMELTDIQEGIIVRCIQQLNEMLGDVRKAAKVIGNPALESKMIEASVAIKRDIVFAASLYTQREAAVV